MYKMIVFKGLLDANADAVGMEIGSMQKWSECF